MLSNDEIRDEVCNADFDWHYGWTLDDVEQNRFVTFARAIEAAVLAKLQAQSEPVMFAYQYDDGTWHDASATEHSAGMKPLYAAPVQQEKQK